jgi:hypothetical protein
VSCVLQVRQSGGRRVCAMLHEMYFMLCVRGKSESDISQILTPPRTQGLRCCSLQVSRCSLLRFCWCPPRNATENEYRICYLCQDRAWQQNASFPSVPLASNNLVPFRSSIRFHQLAFINSISLINSLSSTRFHQLAFCH